MVYKVSKVVLHFSCWLPFGYILYGIDQRSLGADPQEVVLEIFGLWALIILLLCLTLSPIASILKKPILIRYRRMLGLYFAFYLSLHLITFFVFFAEMDIKFLLAEVWDRPYISIGILAWILTLPLVFTSTKKMQRYLGRRWKKLHQLTYLIAILGSIHFLWQSKSDLNEPLIYTIWLILLLGYRLNRKLN